MLARAPMTPLPESIINRPKTGFSLPMAQWLSEGNGRRAWDDLSILAPPNTPWARRWAKVILQRMTE
jgi:asparagine synthase (glutamine-hydrolysing)